MNEDRVREIAEEVARRIAGERPLSSPLDIDTLFALKKGGFILTGSATLASGVATVVNSRIRGNSTAVVTYLTPAGTTGANLKAVCADGSLTITAIATDGTTVTTDTSEVSYLIIL